MQNTVHVLRTTGVEVARTAMRDTIKQNIYNRYTPVQYKRRREYGGLADPENTVVKVYSGLKRKRNGASKDIDLEDIGEMVVHYMIGNKAKRTIISRRDNPRGFSSRKIAPIYYDRNWNLLNKRATEDLLYLWKDEGSVYNLFDSPDYFKYSRPAHLNESLDKRIIKSVNSGVISKALLERYRRSFPNSKLYQR